MLTGGAEAFEQPVPGLNEDEVRRFAFGNRLFETRWTIAPGSVATLDGLGPLYNRRSCAGCHVRDGRGRPPLPNDPFEKSMLLRTESMRVRAYYARARALLLVARSEKDESRRRDLLDLAKADAKTLAKLRWPVAPGFAARVIGRQVLSPLDLERQFGLLGGDIFHGALTLNQLFSARPMLGHADYRGPLKGLYHCGSGAHPGGGVTGAPGHNAARTILSDHRALFG